MDSPQHRPARRRPGERHRQHPGSVAPRLAELPQLPPVGESFRRRAPRSHTRTRNRSHSSSRD
eukprot:8521598-Pyramimonas_sp.AAC.1